MKNKNKGKKRAQKVHYDIAGGSELNIFYSVGIFHCSYSHVCFSKTVLLKKNPKKQNQDASLPTKSSKAIMIFC